MTPATLRAGGTRRPETLPVLTLPGHQGTRGLRIRRALVRMNRKVARKAASNTKPVRSGVSSRNFAGRSNWTVIAAKRIIGR